LGGGGPPPYLPFLTPEETVPMDSAGADFSGIRMCPFVDGDLAGHLLALGVYSF
jgi:hypothetical protein